MAISVNINASTVGASIMNAADPSAVTWIRVNADNTITYRTAAQTLSDIGAQAAGTAYSLAATLAAGNDGNALDIVNLAGFQDSFADRSIDIENRQLVTLTGAVWSIDWQNRLQADTAGQNSIDWQNRALIDNTLVTTFDWQGLAFPTLAGGGTQMLTVDNVGAIGVAAITVGTVTAVTGSGNIASSGGTTPNITFTGVLPTANGGTGVNIASAALTLGTASTTDGELVLKSSANAFTTTIKTGVTGASYTLTLPTTDGASGEFLQTDGSGVLTWAAASSGITVGTTTITSGTTLRIPYNLAGVYQEQANFTIGSVAAGFLDVPTGYALAGHQLIKEVNTTSLTMGNGSSPSLTGATNTLYGYNAGKGNGIGDMISNTGCVVIGYFSGSINAATNAVVIGNNAINYAAGGGTGNSNILIGANTRSAGDTNIVIGTSTTLYAGSNNINIGGADIVSNNTQTLTDCQMYGRRSGFYSTSGISGSLAFGFHSYNTASNQVNFGGGGGGAGGGTYFTDFVIGGGSTNASNSSIRFRVSSGAGSNIAGASVINEAGASTGSGTPGTWSVKTSTTLGSGTTLQTLVSRLIVSGGAVTTDASTATWADALDFVFGTTTGSKIGTATSQKIGFWNATPLAQQTTASAAATFVANSSAIADDTATFDGYTIGQVVKVLRNLGILA